MVTVKFKEPKLVHGYLQGGCSCQYAMFINTAYAAALLADRPLTSKVFEQHAAAVAEMPEWMNVGPVKLTPLPSAFMDIFQINIVEN